MVSCEPLAHSPLNVLPCSLHTCTQGTEKSVKLNTSTWAVLHQHQSPYTPLMKQFPMLVLEAILHLWVAQKLSVRHLDTALKQKVRLLSF